MQTELEHLIRISNTLAVDKSLVVGTGGNTSAKTFDGKYMYIKASGTALKDMDADYGWRRLSIKSVLAILQNESLAFLEASQREIKLAELLKLSCDDEVKNNLRASVESTLHVILDKYVIHLHALDVLCYACAKNGKAKISELFIDEQYPPLWVDYADPGFSLSVAVFKETKNYHSRYGIKPAVMILEKHGLIVADADPDGALKLVHNVVNRCRSKLKTPWDNSQVESKTKDPDSAKKNIQKAIAKVFSKDVPISHFANQTITAFTSRKDAKELLAIPALTPDEMGFVNRPVLWLQEPDYKTTAEKLRDLLDENKNLPVAFLSPSDGLFVVGKKGFAEITQEVITGSLFVRMNANDMGGLNPLTGRQRSFIENWEGEKFRVKMAEKS